MEMKDQNVTKSTSQSRRKFLMRTGVGLVVASLPARSVWAGSGGIAQSIVASGHGSDFANGQCLHLKSSGFFGNNGNGSQANSFAETAARFTDIFPGHPLDLPPNPSKPIDEILMADVLQVNGEFIGSTKINRFMAAVYMNAVYHGQFGIYFPVIGSSPSLQTASDMANYLWNLASHNNTAVLSKEFEDLVNNRHPGSFQCS
ncbi:hypothetical protein [Alkalimonas sp.]|uniref:hypothetical protein n=1 Tax=Alkalimonas sp. TaxID=1872453 RepID=UPI00263B5953|nr:hypothetical protein [Alkalimonas sp.]MCC5825852.1 hypothetical protein [Alkalimonas sp.]